MSLFYGLFSTLLPDMGAEDFSARGEDDVSCCVVVSKLVSSLTVDCTAYLNSFIRSKILIGEWAVELMHDDLSDLFNIDDIEALSVDGHYTVVALLATGIWIEGGFVEDDEVG